MSIICPQCGDSLDVGIARLVSCPSCSSSVFIENNTVSLSNLSVVKNTDEYLFKVGNIVLINDTTYTPQGYCLYEYEGGFRVEWELHDSEENTFILNQEEENLFLVKQVSEITSTLPAWSSMQPNTLLSIDDDKTKSEWLVVEKKEVTFVAYHGSLKNIPVQNKQLKCTYLSNTEGDCLVLVFDNHGYSDSPHNAYQGWWLDPMDLRSNV